MSDAEIDAYIPGGSIWGDGTKVWEKVANLNPTFRRSFTDGILGRLAERYMTTKDENDARLARSLLLTLARKYPSLTWFAHGRMVREDRGSWRSRVRGGWARLHGNECQIYYGACVWDIFQTSPSFSQADRDFIEQNYYYALYRDMGQRNSTQKPYTMSKAYYSSQEQAAKATSKLMLITGDTMLADDLVEMTGNFLKNVSDEGVSINNCISSYGATVWGGVKLLDMLADQGVDLFPGNDKLRNMTCSFYKMSFSSGIIPTNHDGGHMDVECGIQAEGEHGQMFEALESGLKHYPDDKELRQINTFVRKLQDDTALQDVARLDELLPSRAWEDIGFGMLVNRTPTDPRDWIETFYDWGVSGGSHGHPDKLHIILYGHNEILSPPRPKSNQWKVPLPPSRRTGANPGCISRRSLPGRGIPPSADADRRVSL
jgi:hypothetical protein